MRFALVGTPNCGKSNLFNQVAGYKSETGNFSGTSVTFMESKGRVLGKVVGLVDFPGTYTLTGTNPADCESLRYLLTRQVDVIIKVLDGTQLGQGLSLTLELLELSPPRMVAVNMMDEAARLGIAIDKSELERKWGIQCSRW
jgi:ferrous iron transport protein B